MTSGTFWQHLATILAGATSLVELGQGLATLTDGAPLAFEKRRDGNWQSLWSQGTPVGKSLLTLGTWGRLRTSAAAKQTLAAAADLLAAAASRLETAVERPAAGTPASPGKPAAKPRRPSEAAVRLDPQTIIGTFMHTAPAAIALTDPNGRLVMVNRRFLVLFGFDDEPPIGMDISRLRRHFSESRRFLGWLQDLPDVPGRTLDLDVRQTEPEARHLNITASPAHGADGRLAGYLFIVRDTTQQANVDQMKTELINVVSHELRTPLTSVLGFAELVLIRDLPSDKVRQYVGTIYTEGKRLSALLDDFLDINRLESRQQPYHMRQVNLAPIVRKVAAVFAADEAHPVVVDLPPAIPPVRADADRLVQALTNLVSNAVKYSPDGGPVHIRAEVQPDQQRLVVRVRDQGLGIPASAIGNLFSKFFRVHRPGHEGIGGTGLGLAIVHEIIRAHGGDVWVDSEEGVGSTFSFTLPIRSRSPRQAAPVEKQRV